MNSSKIDLTDQGSHKLPSTKPLHIRKQSSQVSIARFHKLQDKNPYKDHSSPSTSSPAKYPPRTSSCGMSPASNALFVPPNQPDEELIVPQSTVSEWTDEYVSDSIRSSPSTVSDIKEMYLNSPNSEIMGNFVPVPESKHSSENNDAKFFAPTARAANPYEFEPDSPYIPHNMRPDTTFSNFIAPASRDLQSPKPPRPLHIKHARSESHNYLAVQNAGAADLPPAKGIGYSMQRSESSPNVTPNQAGRFADRFPENRRESSPNLNAGTYVDRFPDQARAVSPDIVRYRTGSESIPSQSRRGRSPDRLRHGRFDKYGEVINSGNGHQSQSASYGVQSQSTKDRTTFQQQNPNSYAVQPPACSPSRLPIRKSNGNFSQGSDSNCSRQGRNSPTKTITLQDVKERDESIIEESPIPPSVSEMKAKARSRSPMKKMFGENGWLGKTPNEAQEIYQKHGHKPKQPPSAGKEKSTMIGRLKNKLGEIAERADLNNISSTRSSRSSIEKSNAKTPKLSVLSVSLSAPEQAKIYMELELMLVISANSFLMNQFSQGRIAVDTIKKIVDQWKSKGRPVVIEFMYDQGTQRDLVALNQHNFRFYGERAGDANRINGMLYNWRAVANLMSVRTLCNADTVILKLLFDVEQILELLGAREPVMLRLQQIRSQANEMMRLERQRRSEAYSVMEGVNGGREAWSTQSRSSMDDNGAARGYSVDMNGSRNQSMDGMDPYGGMKLVPEGYDESSDSSSRPWSGS